MKQTETFSAEKILTLLPKKVFQHLAALEILTEIDSTNSYLLRNLKKNDKNRVVFAEKQTAGRGRLQKKWIATDESIACSFLWNLKRTNNDSALSLVIAVCLIHALTALGAEEEIKIKWPNDLYFNNKKLAGILLERNKNHVVIGIGINLNVCETIGEIGISVQEIINKPISRNYFAGTLITAVVQGLVAFEKNGFKYFLEEYQKRDALFEKNVILLSPTSKDEGIVKGVNEQGELILLKANGDFATFSYGEVSVQF